MTELWVLRVDRPDEAEVTEFVVSVLEQQGGPVTIAMPADEGVLYLIRTPLV